MISLATLFVGPGTILLDIETPDRRGETVVAWILVGLGALYLLFAIVRIFTDRGLGHWLLRLRDMVIGLGLLGCPLAIMNGLVPWKAAVAVWVLPMVAFLTDRRHVLLRWRTGRGNDEPVLRTRFLHVVLDADTALPDCQIIRGRFRGRSLSELSPEELYAVLSEASSDRDSISILTSIALRFRESDRKRDEGNGRGRGGADGAHGAGTSKSASATMDIAEAYRVLGVAPGMSEAEILAAHRRLMKMVHPDKGGSDYFASKLNEARDLLLGR